MLFVVSGSSGVGKNTIINQLLKTMDQIMLLPTFTTRAMREGESEGNPYYFVDRSGFEKMISDNEMLEFCEIHENLYGVNRRVLKELLNQGKILIKDIDVNGTLALKDELGESIFAFYLRAPSKEELVRRLKGRGEPDIEKRLARYDYEESMTHHYDYVITNNDLDETVVMMKKVIEEKLKQFYRS